MMGADEIAFVPPPNPLTISPPSATRPTSYSSWTARRRWRGFHTGRAAGYAGDTSRRAGLSSVEAPRSERLGRWSLSDRWVPPDQLHHDFGGRPGWFSAHLRLFVPVAPSLRKRGAEQHEMRWRTIGELVMRFGALLATALLLGFLFMSSP